MGWINLSKKWLQHSSVLRRETDWRGGEQNQMNLTLDNKLVQIALVFWVKELSICCELLVLFSCGCRCQCASCPAVRLCPLWSAPLALRRLACARDLLVWSSLFLVKACWTLLAHLHLGPMVKSSCHLMC